jgi:hypothetical protein
MTLRSALALSVLAVAANAPAEDLSKATFGPLAQGPFEIRTEDRVYRGEMLDPATGRCRLAVSLDGQQFTAPSTVYVLGATEGRYPDAGGLMLVKMHQVRPGMRLELGIGSLEQKHRRITAPVVEVRRLSQP